MINKKYSFSFSSSTVRGLINVFLPPVAGGNMTLQFGAGASDRYAIPPTVGRHSGRANSPDFFTVNSPLDEPQPTKHKYSSEKISPPTDDLRRSDAQAFGRPGFGLSRVNTASAGADAKINTTKEPYATLERMRKVTSGHDADEDGSFFFLTNNGKVRRFLEQACFMKDFEDDYQHEKPFTQYSYYSVYEYMDYDQLRSYFTWRTKAVKGVHYPTFGGYVFCYIYELINGVHPLTPEETLSKLIDLWTFHKPYVSELDRHMKIWLRDYYAVHHGLLTESFDIWYSRFPTNIDLINEYAQPSAFSLVTSEQMKQAISCDFVSLSVIELSSSYKITKGAFYKKGDRDLIERCVTKVMIELALYFFNNKSDISRVFYSTKRSVMTTLFPRAIYEHDAYADIPLCTIALGPGLQLRKRKANWSLEYAGLDTYRSAVSYILKVIERSMRIHFEFGRQLSLPNPDSVVKCFCDSDNLHYNRGYSNYYSGFNPSRMKVWKRKALELITGQELIDAIETAIEAFLDENHLKVIDGVLTEVSPVVIDLGSLDKIRDELSHTAARLNTEDADQGAVPGEQSTEQKTTQTPEPEAAQTSEHNTANDSIHGLLVSLSPEEAALLSSLISPVLRDAAYPELTIEAINEKALTCIGDNLIDFYDGRYIVYDEYADDITAALDRMGNA